MNILMVTNTYAPHVGGVARSVAGFATAYRARGHRVLVVAPVFENADDAEDEVIRVPALQKVNGSDFSVVLPVPGYLDAAVGRFAPDVVHAHHPFLLGGTAMRLAHGGGIPLVFTHHTMYERYTHYVPGDCSALKRFVIHLSTNYANLCEMVFAPSESIRDVLQGRGVHVPIRVVPTGVDTERFGQGDGTAFRHRLGIPQDAFVVGHVGRLAPEKNLAFLARAVCRFQTGPEEGHTQFLVAGEGPSEAAIRQVAEDFGVSGRLHRIGVLSPRELADAYHAMDVFAFASESETQGMVLTEAMAAGVPVVALDASGVREVVRDGVNGYLLEHSDEGGFADALNRFEHLNPADRVAFKDAARGTADAFSMAHSATAALSHYRHLECRPEPERRDTSAAWEKTVRRIRTEWEMVRGVAAAAEAALTSREEHGSEDHVRPG